MQRIFNWRENFNLMLRLDSIFIAYEYIPAAVQGWQKGNVTSSATNEVGGERQDVNLIYRL